VKEKPVKKKPVKKAKTFAKLIAKNRRYPKKRGLTREEYLSYLYQQKNVEARKLRAAINSFIKAISRIRTPSEKARLRKKR
jgi:hypothetical protein